MTLIIFLYLHLFVRHIDILTYPTPQFLSLLLRYQSKRLSPYIMITPVFLLLLLVPYYTSSVFYISKIYFVSSFSSSSSSSFSECFSSLVTNDVHKSSDPEQNIKFCFLKNILDKYLHIGIHNSVGFQVSETHLSSGISSLARLKLL